MMVGDMKPVLEFTEAEQKRWEEMTHEEFSPTVITFEEYERLKKEGSI